MSLRHYIELEQKSAAKPATKAVHAGQPPDPSTGALIPPLHLTSTFVLDEEAAELLCEGSGLPADRFVYGRMGNPTQQAFEEKMAALEGTESALATSSGMAAISLALIHSTRPGDHVLAWEHVYGHTYEFLTNFLPRMGVEVSFVRGFTPDALSKEARPNTRAVYGETISNPLLHVPDLASVAQWARKRHITAIIDNTLASPALCTPRELGIDVVVHSATKYIGGHGDALGGVVLGSRDFVNGIRSGWYKYLGPVQNPLGSWLFNRGLKSLVPRMAWHSNSALSIAEYLRLHPAVQNVFYPGLPTSPEFLVAKKQLSSFSGMVSFTVHGDATTARHVMQNTRIVKVALSLGDAGSLISHPASMSHRGVPQTQRVQLGVTDNLLRLSVGLEDVQDLKDDLGQALNALL